MKYMDVNLIMLKEAYLASMKKVLHVPKTMQINGDNLLCWRSDPTGIRKFRGGPVKRSGRVRVSGSEIIRRLRDSFGLTCSTFAAIR